MTNKYEYKDFVWQPIPGNSGSVSIGQGGYTPLGARHEIWSWHQSHILFAIQEEINQGWEPITEVGPSSIQTRELKKLNVGGYIFFSIFTLGFGLLAPFFFLYPVLEPVEIRIKMRRLIKN